MHRRPTPTWLPYLAAVLATAAATLVGEALVKPLGTSLLFVLYFAAVAFAGWRGGFRPALLATVLSYIAANLLFIVPRDVFVINTTVLAFLFVCLAIAAFSEAMKRARQRAEASAEQIVALVESITDGFMAVDSQWQCTYMNSAAEELNRLHRQNGTSLGWTSEALFPLAIGGAAESQLRQAATDRTAVEFESYYEPWDRWFEIKAWPAEESSLAIFFRDVTERKLAQVALTQSEERLRLAQHGAKAGLWDWDVTSGEITWSDEYYEICGLDRSVAPSRAVFLQCVHADDRARVDEALTQATRHGQSIDIDFRIIHPEKGIRWVAGRGRGTADSGGRSVRSSGIVLDITERKNAEESLRFLSEAGAVLSTLFDFESTMHGVTRLAIQHFSDSCVIDMINPIGQVKRVALAHKDPVKEGVLRELLERYPLDWTSEALPVKVLRTGRPELVEKMSTGYIESVAQDEEHRRLMLQLNPVSVIVVPLMVGDKAIGTLSFVNSDSRRRYTAVDLEVATELARRVAVASDNARLYGELREAQRQKDDFLAMLAHELRNPLAAISYANELSKISDQDQAMVADVVDRQLANLSRILDDLLDVSRITRDKVQLKKTHIDAAELVRRAVATAQSFTEKRKHKVTLEVASEPMPLLVDPTRVEQILGNLLTNAAKYTPESGAIVVRTFPQDGQAVFTVKDSGVGIAPAMLPKVFELFMQADRSLDRSQGGLGVGLTLVRKLAEMHGGSVSAKSDGPGRGSEFTIRLPLTEQRADEVATAKDAAAPVQPLKIFVVDDNIDLAENISALLRRNGHIVATAHEGFAAIEGARSFGPDVVLLDLGLPGLDGYCVARTLRGEAEFEKVRFIAFSGYGQPEDRRRSKEAGFSHHLVKPVKFETLCSILSAH